VTAGSCRFSDTIADELWITQVVFVDNRVIAADGLWITGAGGGSPLAPSRL
jgi:hypothetical protein